MFAPERLSIIRSYLKEHRQLDVHSISELLNVSEVTIRRDLEKLETDGYLKRIHGGAVLPSEDGEPEYREITPAERAELENGEEIVRIALFMIQDDDVIMLLNGNLNRMLARKLKDRSNVTVLTNDIDIASEIAAQGNNKAVLLGGNLDIEHKALFGSLAQANIQKFFVNRMFIEVDGISEKLLLTVSSQEQADLILEARSCTDEIIIMCTAEHFGRNAFYRLGTTDLADKIITNTHIADSYKAAIFAQDKQLFTSINAFEGNS